MDYKKLADMLFPDVTLTKDDLEKMYPERNLSKGAIVTRFAPSPTGFLHIGSVFTCLVASNFAKLSSTKVEPKTAKILATTAHTNKV